MTSFVIVTAGHVYPSHVIGLLVRLYIPRGLLHLHPKCHTQSLLDYLGCCRRTHHRLAEDQNTSTLLPYLSPAVKLDLNSAGPLVVLLKQGLRICGDGCARATAPIVQNKAYFEAKIQSTGRWIIGLGSIKTPLDSFEELIADPSSWVLREDGTFCNGNRVCAQLDPVPEEGDILGLAYDHVELRLTLNGLPVTLSTHPDGAGSLVNLSGMKGTLYPVVGVAANAVLDLGFSRRDFYHPPPAPGDFEEILWEKELL